MAAAKPRVVVLGGAGLVGSRLVELWAAQADVVAPAHAALDVLDHPALAAFLRKAAPATLVNAAAWADVDGAEAERGDEHGQVYRLNAELPDRLARLCAGLDAHLVHLSTDYVFDGTQASRPYREDDPPNPLGWYAATKLLGERAALAANPDVAVARIEMPFRAHFSRKSDLARTVAARLSAGQSMVGVSDQRITPVFLDDAVRALWCLTQARYAGVIHVGSSDSTTPLEYARGVAVRLGLDAGLIRPAPLATFATSRPAARPQHSWLDITRFVAAFGEGILRPVEAQLDAWAAQMRSRAGSG